MTTTERITLPEIPGVTFCDDGFPIWSTTAIDEASTDLGRRLPDDVQVTIRDAIDMIADLESPQLFDEVVTLLHRRRAEAIEHRQILAEAGWTPDLALAYERQEALDRIEEHRREYDLLVAATTNLPVDPRELDWAGACEVADKLERIRAGFIDWLPTT